MLAAKRTNTKQEAKGRENENAIFLTKSPTRTVKEKKKMEQTKPSKRRKITTFKTDSEYTYSFICLKTTLSCIGNVRKKEISQERKTIDNIRTNDRKIVSLNNSFLVLLELIIFLILLLEKSLTKQKDPIINPTKEEKRGKK